jgi:O-Antigen ligase
VRAVSRVAGRIDSGIVVAGVVAAVLFWLSYDDGSYELASRGTLAIVVWWAVILGVALSLLGSGRVPRAALVVGGLLAALAYWTLASIFWAPSEEAAFNEFNRVSLYLGVYILVAFAATRRTVGRWADGLAVAITAVAVVALVSRFFPDTFSDRELAEFLPAAATRLSFPLGYWNGLAIFVALGLPLLFRIALVGRNGVVRALALVPVPVIACVVYLASSRGGVVTGLLGTLAFLVLSERRWSASAAIGVSAAASAAAIAVLLDRDELVNGPLGTEIVREQGRSSALLVGLACIGGGVAFGLGCRLLAGRVAPSVRAGRIAAGFAALLALVVVAASDPIDRFETFKALPGQGETIDRGDYVTAHLLSSGGSGRWQLWGVAVDGAEENPLLGIGAGSYEHWWAEHATHTQFVRDGHSLYLETLGELGVVAFLLVLALAVIGVVVGGMRAQRAEGESRVTIAALTAVFVGYAAAAGFDWVWELTAVSLVGLAALALVTGPATESLDPVRAAAPEERAPWVSRHRFGVGLVVVLTAWVLVVAQAIPLLADRELARSQAAAQRRDLEEAEDAAEVARAVQPWASSPHLQLALVHELQDDVQQARAWIREAIERDDQDWQLWLVSSRLETKAGNVARASADLRRAIELNPRSPLFVGLVDELDESG